MKNNTAQTAEDPILQWVTFRLDNETYGINVMQVQEVLRHTEIAPVPGAPKYVLGFINLLGIVAPVISTRQPFGLAPPPVTGRTVILIIRADGQVLGVLVTGVPGGVSLGPPEM